MSLNSHQNPVQLSLTVISLTDKMTTPELLADLHSLRLSKSYSMLWQNV